MTIRGKEMLEMDVLEVSEEDGHHGVPFDVVQRAFFEEDVCFVDEHDGSPRR